jgi:hypothetical protein
MSSPAANAQAQKNGGADGAAALACPFPDFDPATARLFCVLVKESTIRPDMEPGSDEAARLWLQVSNDSFPASSSGKTQSVAEMERRVLHYVLRELPGPLSSSSPLAKLSAQLRATSAPFVAAGKTFGAKEVEQWESAVGKKHDRDGVFVEVQLVRPTDDLQVEDARHVRWEDGDAPSEEEVTEARAEEDVTVSTYLVYSQKDLSAAWHRFIAARGEGLVMKHLLEREGLDFHQEPEELLEHCQGLVSNNLEGAEGLQIHQWDLQKECILKLTLPHAPEVVVSPEEEEEDADDEQEDGGEDSEDDEDDAAEDDEEDDEDAGAAAGDKRKAAKKDGEGEATKRSKPGA